MKRSIWFWMYFVFAVIFAIYFSVRIIMTLLGHGSVTTIKKISISTDSQNYNLSQISAAAGITPGTKTFSVNLDDIQTRLMQIPDVKNVAVRRLGNGNLSIKAKMHKIVAVWANEENFYPLSQDGTIINRVLAERPENSLLFHGNLPSDLSDIIKNIKSINNKIEYLEWIENRRWNITTKNSIEILLPEKDYIASIGNLILMDKKNQILSKDIKLIDMRDSERILIK